MHWLAVSNYLEADLGPGMDAIDFVHGLELNTGGAVGKFHIPHCMNSYVSLYPAHRRIFNSPKHI